METTANVNNSKYELKWSKHVIENVLSINFDEEIHNSYLNTPITHSSLEEICNIPFCEEAYNEFITYLLPSCVANCKNDAKFIPLKDYESSYEILNFYPFSIRNKRTKRILTVNYSHKYPRVTLNGETKYLHQVIALQFIFNDDLDNKTEVDHCLQNTNDFHLEELRWVTHSTNCENRTSNRSVEYNYVDKIPNEAIVITEYGKHQFEFYYYYDNTFYFYNGVRYRILPILTTKDGSLFVNAHNINNKCTKIYINKFKRDYDLL